MAQTPKISAFPGMSGGVWMTMAVSARAAWSLAGSLKLPPSPLPREAGVGVEAISDGASESGKGFKLAAATDQATPARGTCES